jgi:hypothetical protein
MIAGGVSVAAAITTANQGLPLLRNRGQRGNVRVPLIPRCVLFRQLSCISWSFLLISGGLIAAAGQRLLIFWDCGWSNIPVFSPISLWGLAPTRPNPHLEHCQVCSTWLACWLPPPLAPGESSRFAAWLVAPVLPLLVDSFFSQVAMLAAFFS